MKNQKSLRTENRVEIIDIKELNKADNELPEWITHRNGAFELNFT